MARAFFCHLLLFACAAMQGLQFAHSAAIIENHTSSWRDSGLTDSLAEAFDLALPDELFNQVLEEAIAFERHEKDERARAAAAGGAYVHGKGGTYWRPLFNAQGEFLRPRFAIEAAIQLFYKMDFGTSAQHPRVTGGEWWVQKRDLKEDIGFHHDKDEAMASLKSTMKFPEVSTVTYLTGQGAPTVIFNQTTPDGNGALPITPRKGGLSYPKVNRHMRFRGNLQHGVPSYLSPELQEGTFVQLRGSGRERITFLVNWWKVKPMGPNCNKITTHLVKQLGVYDREGVARLMAQPSIRSHQPVRVETRAMVIPPELPPNSPDLAAAGNLKRSRYEITIPGEEVIWYDLPEKREKGHLYSIDWPLDGIFSNICRLDLRTNVVRALFHEPRPKVIVFANEQPTLEWLRPMASEMEDEVRFVIGNPSSTADALRTFGLEAKDCPTAVIHTTRPHDVKYLMPMKKQDNGPPIRRKLNAKNLRKMISKFFAGKLAPLGGNNAEDDDAE